tara:strand:+ start:774 stop:959 length:186 start_codon:yes stop_codon:yes gene_type:complete
MINDQEGPFASAVNSNAEGIVRKEITTYRIRDGIMIKETATRTYNATGDYNDSVATIPLTN